MIEPLGGASVGEEMPVDLSEIKALESIDPKSDVRSLLLMPGPELSATLSGARYLYHSGAALWNGRMGSRIERVREILTLRARFARLSPEQLVAQRAREDADEKSSI